MATISPADASKRKLLFRFGMIFIVLFFIYAPLINGFFLIFDDCTHFSGMSRDFNFQKQVASGRPLLGIIVLGMIKIFQGIDGAFQVRLLGVIGLTLFASLVNSYLRKLKFSEINSFLITIMIFTLPSWLMTFAWLTLALCIWLTILAYTIYILLVKSIMAWGTSNRKIAILTYCISTLIFVMLLSTYQLSPFYFWIFVAGALIYDHDRNIRKGRILFLNALVLTFISILAYMVFWKVLMIYSHLSPIERTEPSYDILGQLKWFVFKVVPQFINLWNIYENPAVTRFALILLINGFIAGMYPSKVRRQHLFGYRRNLTLTLCILSLLPAAIPGRTIPWYLLSSPLKISISIAIINFVQLVWYSCQIQNKATLGLKAIFPYLERCLWISCTVPMSWLPCLLVKSRWPAYRTSFGIDATLLLILIASLLAILRLVKITYKRTIFTAILGVMMFLGAMTQNRNAAQMSDLLNMELRYVMAQLRRIDVQHIHKITIIRPYWFNWMLYDEFGVPATRIQWGYQGLTILAMKESGIRPPKNLKFNWVEPGYKATEGPKELIIDMTPLNEYFKYRKRY